MPRIGKSTPSNNSSEIVSSVDSRYESSSSVDSSDGSGDEGITIPGSNAVAASATTPSGAALPAHLSPLKIIVGTFCALTALSGGIMCMYASTHQDTTGSIKTDLERALLGVGLPMMFIGSVVAIGSFLYNPETPS
jgi:hypothetical protein